MIRIFDIFRFLGDILCISSKIALIRKIKNTNSISGISLKTQILYLLVYIFRYTNSPLIGKSTPLSIYNLIMKIVYISFQVYLISLFYGKHKSSYSKKYDTFNIPIFLVVSIPISLFFKEQTEGVVQFGREFLFTCSLILESLAVLPQLALVQDSGECEKLTAISITLLGLYRLSYFIYFILKRIITQRPIDNLMVVTSLIQSVLYFDFYRVYYNFIK